MTDPTPGGAEALATRDVVELILADLPVAHAEAEDAEVYPTLARKAPEDEERDVLNAARKHVDPDTRARLGEAFLRVRREWLDRNPGDVGTVRGIVDRERERGRL